MVSPNPESPDHRAWIRNARFQSDEAERQAAGSSIGTGLNTYSKLSADYFPGYTLEREIHRGAQGVVYRAVQESTRRVVALKVLREGPFAGAPDRARFDREVQVLAQLRHPDIVAIHDSGDADGHFYLVMDYVEGRPLDPHAASYRDIRETLQFFVRICDAVNAAHLRGVMHRDLKPGNILVDSEGGPHVVDFGLAKFTDASGLDDDNSDAPTLTGQFVGSLPWCSPEQADGGVIDIRTDVYSLGVLLYQMLTGSFPYSVTGRASEVLERVRTQTPQSPRAMRRGIDDEVATILLKCLQKEPQRRYQSAGELARDLQHYLAGEAIEAKRDSAAYLLRKSLRRHWIPASIAAAFILLIAVGLAVSLTQWRSAVHERNRAQAAEKKQDHERQRAEAENRKLQRVNRFVQNLLISADPNSLSSGDVPARALLDNASQEIDAGALREQPEEEAAVRVTLGRAYTTLGRYDSAGVHLETAMRILEKCGSQDDTNFADALVALAVLHLQTDDHAEAEAFARRGLAARRALYGDSHEDVASAWISLADILYTARRIDEAVAAMRESIAAYRNSSGDQSPAVADAMAKLANYLHGSVESEDLLMGALRVYEQSGDDHSLRYGRLLSGLARIQHMRRDYEAAEKSYVRAISLVTEVTGGPNRQQLNDLESLALLYMHSRSWRRAMETNLESVRVARSLQGDNSPRVVNSLLSLSTSYSKLKEYQKGENAAREALDILIRTGADQSLDGAVARINIATHAMNRGELDTAEEAARQCLAIPDDALSGQAWRKSIAQSLLGEVLTHRRQFADAESSLIAGHEGLASSPSAYADLRENSRRRLVKLYEAWHAAEPDKGHDQKAAEWRQQLSELGTSSKPAAASVAAGEAPSSPTPHP